MLAGLVSHRVSNVGGITGLVLGMTVGLIGFVLGQSVEGFAFFSQNQYMIPCTVGASLLGLLIGTFMCPSSVKEKAAIENFFDQTESEAPAGEGEIYSEGGVSPLPVIGFSIGTLGVVLLVLMLFSSLFQEGLVSLVVGFGLLLMGLAFYVLPKWKKS
ncbi:MAG: hypothetical protein KC931_24565, partial [Candidatus Omnitrophica bacterium]|nr:hypothetical protein [Candidatus Omnitrophota bacterium]